MLRKTGWEKGGLDLVQDRDKWWAVVNTVMELRKLFLLAADLLVTPELFSFESVRINTVSCSVTV